MSSTRTFVFAGGGTGGHLFPGFAVADELLARYPGARVVFAGSDRPIERQILAGRGCERLVLPCESLHTLRRNPLRFVWNNLRSLRLAEQWIAANAPDVVFGLGGFASAPLVRAAASRRIPVVLLEQNLVAGRATRWLSRRAALVCTSFAETAADLGPGVRTCLTGNPVRRSVAQLARPLSRPPGSEQRTLLVLGGSQGAQAVNAAVLDAAAALRASLCGWRIVHQTGAAQAESVRRRYRELRISAVVEPFFHDLPAWYRTADLAIARAGATTLAELACAGVPALLIPYPGAARDHQSHNARAFAAAGAARVVPQQSSTARTASELGRSLLELLDGPGIRERMRRAMRSLARPDVASAVVVEVERLLGRDDLAGRSSTPSAPPAAPTGSDGVELRPTGPSRSAA